MVSSLIKQKIQTNFLTYLKDKYSIKLKNKLEIPILKKIVIHRSLAKTSFEKRKFLTTINELKLITGQCPTITLSKTSSNTFKQKSKTPVGLKVTLRKERMYYFLEKLILFILPREIDFNGCLETSFDKKGNFNLGIKNQSSFPELDSYYISFQNGFNINLVFQTNNILYTKLLLEFLGIPFV